MLDKKNKCNSANIGALLLSRGTGLGMIVILCLLGLRAPLFFEMTNIMTVLKQGSVLTMIALGLTAVLIGGGFDMGAGALVQLTCQPGGRTADCGHQRGGGNHIRDRGRASGRPHQCVSGDHRQDTNLCGDPWNDVRHAGRHVLV